MICSPIILAVCMIAFAPIVTSQEFDLSHAQINVSQVFDPINRPASLAIDGNLDVDGMTSCTIVGAAVGSNNVWIAVNLGQMVNVRAVWILTRFNDFAGAAEQMSNFIVYVAGSSDISDLNDDMICVSYDGNLPADFDQQMLTCNRVLTGDHVIVTKTAGTGPARFLTVCELKVFGVPETSQEFDLSSATITVSGLFDSNRGKSLAIDGNLDDDGQYCTIVAAGGETDDVWMAVNLSQMVNVGAIAILPRTNDFAGAVEQMSNFTVYVAVSSDIGDLNDDMICVSYVGNLPTDFELQMLTCNRVLTGDHVIVKKISTGTGPARFLTLCELKVFGGPAIVRHWNIVIQ